MEMLIHLNLIVSFVQFTVETGNDPKISFLDFFIGHHTNWTLSTSVFRRETHSDSYLAFDSHHLFAHKKAVVFRAVFKEGDKSNVKRFCTMQRYMKTVLQRIASQVSQSAASSNTIIKSKSIVSSTFLDDIVINGP